MKWPLIMVLAALSAGLVTCRVRVAAVAATRYLFAFSLPVFGLALILDELRAAAPDAEIIVIGPWNRNLGFFPETDPLFRALDGAMRQASAASGARFADVFLVFNPQGDPDAEATAICAFTLLCAEGDGHPSDLGYRAIADVVFDASGYARLEPEG